MLVRSIVDGSAEMNEIEALGFDNVFAIKSDPEIVQVRKSDDSLRSIDAEERRVRYLMSTSNPVGRSGDIILSSGWDFTEFQKRGAPFLYDHNLTKTNHGLPLGRMDGMTEFQDYDGRKKKRPSGGYYSALFGDGIFTPRGVNPFNDLVYRMVDEGFLEGFSVGFRALSSRKPTDDEVQLYSASEEARSLGSGLTPYSVVHERTMLIEGSVTSVGMDPDATRVKRMRDRITQLSERGQAGRDESEQLMEMLGMTESTRSVVSVSWGEGIFGQDEPEQNPTVDTGDVPQVDTDQVRSSDEHKGDLESRIDEIHRELAALSDCASNLESLAQEISSVRAAVEDLSLRADLTDRVRSLEIVLGMDALAKEERSPKSDIDSALGL